MSTWHADGFVLDKNPSPRGGGFSVVLEDGTLHGKLIVSHVVWKAGFTNNEGELLAVAYAAHKAAPGDIIMTDAQVMTHWCRSGICGARPDLTYMAANVKKLIADKDLRLVWHNRCENLAGQHNERMTRP